MNNNNKSCKHTWAIRGIEPETRTAATIAARRAGQTVGEWCNRALRDAATDRLKDQVPGPRLEETLAKIMARLEAMEQRTPAPDNRRWWSFGKR